MKLFKSLTVALMAVAMLATTAGPAMANNYDTGPDPSKMQQPGTPAQLLAIFEADCSHDRFAPNVCPTVPYPTEPYTHSLPTIPAPVPPAPGPYIPPHPADTPRRVRPNPAAFVAYW